MKLTSFLTAALLPMGLTAAPTPDEAAKVDARESVGFSANKPAAGGLVGRADQFCATVNADKVNCRAGPGTNYKVVVTIDRGVYGYFTCVKSGECITVGGSTNW